MKFKLSALVLLIMTTNLALSSMQSLSKIGIGVSAIVAGLGLCRQVNLERKERRYQSFSEDAAVVAPELNEVFVQITKDFGITENVRLRIWKDSELANVAAFTSPEGHYSNYSQTVYLGCVRDLFPSKIIHNIAHELEHHRQFQKYPGSKPFSYVNWADNEQGADAAAARYQQCSECLRIVSKDVTEDVQKQGYFSSEDYESYAQEALIKGAQCLAHKQGISNNLNMPLKNYLPS